MKDLGIEYPVAVRPEKIIEALKIVHDMNYPEFKKSLDNKIPCGQSGCRCFCWLITGGSMYDEEKEAARYIPYVEAVHEALPQYNIYVETQACSGKAAERLAKAGLHGLQYNLECWDKKMFYVTCPGKAKNITWEKWINRLVEAVPYFEKGHVYSNQVLGLELQPPEGYYTDLERGKASCLEGHKWFLEHGVAAAWSPFVAYTGTRIENRPCPPTEYYLDIGWETHQMTLEHKMYTPTRFFHCYRGGVYMVSADFARLRWGDLQYNDKRDPCMRGEEKKEEEVLAGAIAK